MKTFLITLLVLQSLTVLSCNDPIEQVDPANTSQTKDPCDDPDAGPECMFANMPSSPGSVLKIAGDSEPGEKMIITGRLLHKDGTTPYADALMYVYHTDANGKYSKKGNEKGVQKWHGYLHGWARTGADGRYEIHSIRPAQYPSNDNPAHIHAHIKEPDGSIYYISDFVFKGDPLLKNHSSNNLTGGHGIVELSKDSNGVWIGTRDIILRN